jgi:predicted AAA+ superfamily ATPase
MIIRKQYLDAIEKFLGSSVIKILTGMRRVGKSTVLLQLRDKLISDGVDTESIVHINMELFTYSHIKNAADLHEYVTDKLKGISGQAYILIDEVQEIEEWERAVQSFLAEDLGQIILTGSNAHMLSSELATLLTGRFIEIPIYPLSFDEFLKFRQTSDNSVDIKDAFVTYLKYGGLPGIHQLPLDDSTTTPYLDAVIDTLVLRDIVQRHKITDVSILDRILNFIMGATGSLISIKKIADYLKSQGLRIGNDKVSQYIHYLCEASIIIKVPRYDIQGKRQMEYLDKYYLTDLGLRYPRMGDSIKRLPGSLETIVFHELLRRGYKVFVGTSGKYEVDFVSKKQDEVLYVQVTTYLSEEATIEREFGNLEAIKDNYPKIVLSIDEVNVGGRNGIKWKHIRDWLLER